MTLWCAVAAAGAALAVLTGPGPYSASMVGLPGEMSNMAPPSVCLLVVTIGQAAAAQLARPRVERLLQRPLPWALVARLGSMGMTLYLWHLVVLFGAFGVLMAAGGSPPEPGTALWWWTRPAWILGLGAVACAIAAALSRLERSRPGDNARRNVTGR